MEYFLEQIVTKFNFLVYSNCAQLFVNSKIHTKDKHFVLLIILKFPKKTNFLGKTPQENSLQPFRSYVYIML